MRFKIQSFEYDPVSGRSHMVANSNYGLLEAYCSPHPQDKDIINEWDAYRFCERKIEIEFMKHKTREHRYKYEGMSNLTMTICMNETFGQKADQGGWWDCLQHAFIQEEVALRNWQKSRERYRSMKNNYRQWCDAWLDERRRQRNMQKNKIEEE